MTAERLLHSALIRWSKELIISEIQREATLIFHEEFGMPADNFEAIESEENRKIVGGQAWREMEYDDFYDRMPENVRKALCKIEEYFLEKDENFEIVRMETMIPAEFRMGFWASEDDNVRLYISKNSRIIFIKQN